MGKLKKGIRIVIAVVAVIAILAVIYVIIALATKPDSSEILRVMETVYKKDFEIVEEFTYITHTDGEVEAQRELKCPAVILQDDEGIRFLAYAYPLEEGDWIYQDNYSDKVLLYCIEQESLEMNNKDACEGDVSSCVPCLVLDNTDITAQKLQNMVIRFNELYQYDEDYGYIISTGCFQVAGGSLVYQVIGGNTSDRWLEETSPFCYDTPIEKYKAFLDAAIEE